MINEIEEEIWRPVPGSNCVEASNLGQIRQFGHILEQVQNKGQAYLRVKGIKKRGKLTSDVHRLVALAWLTLPADFGVVRYDVNHIDEDKHNNRADNLNYLTHRDNIIWGTCPERIGESMKGNKSSTGLIWVNNAVKSYYWPKDEPLPYYLFIGQVKKKKSA